MSMLSAECCVACRRDSPRVTEAEIAELTLEVRPVRGVAVGGHSTGRTPAAGPSEGTGPRVEPSPGSWGSPPERSSWAALLRRVFALDVFQCPRCGGRRRLVGVHRGGESLCVLLARLGSCSRRPRRSRRARPRERRSNRTGHAVSEVVRTSLGPGVRPRLLDLKTAARKYTDLQVEMSLQLSVYSYAASMNGLADQDDVRLRFDVLTKTKQPELCRYWTTRDRAANVRLFRLASEVLRAVKAGVFHRGVVGWQCKECPFRSRCWAWG